ncbi:MAG: type 1 glutamine amidotransferase domain-containing protein [Thermonemataceae bacterium]
MGKLDNRNIAILSEDGFEEVELTSPKQRLLDEGATVHIISPKKKTIRSWKDDNWGMELTVDKLVEEANPADYHGLLIPGGVANPDLLRRYESVVDFIKHFFEEGKPIATICHGPQVLIETGALQHRELTSFPSIKTDLKNAGAKWIDMEVVTDQGLVTSRSPKDLPAFNDKMVEEFREGVHEAQKTV